MSPEELTALKLNRTSGTNHQDIDDATRFLRGTQMKTMGVQKRDVGIQAFTSLLRFEHTLSRQYGKGSFVLLCSSFFLRSFGACGLKGVVFFSSRFFVVFWQVAILPEEWVNIYQVRNCFHNCLVMFNIFFNTFSPVRCQDRPMKMLTNCSELFCFNARNNAVKHGRASFDSYLCSFSSIQQTGRGRPQQ